MTRASVSCRGFSWCAKNHFHELNPGWWSEWVNVCLRLLTFSTPCVVPTTNMLFFSTSPRFVQLSQDLGLCTCTVCLCEVRTRSSCLWLLFVIGSRAAQTTRWRRFVLNVSKVILPGDALVTHEPTFSGRFELPKSNAQPHHFPETPRRHSLQR